MPAAPIVANIVGPDLLIVLAIVLVLFGSSQLPKLARSLGSASKEFRKGLDEGDSESEKEKEKDRKKEA
jgi:sec-independent protein translocase protein TatA